MAYLPFYVTTTGASGNVSLPDLGNRTLPNSLTNYDLGQEFQIEEIRYSKALASAIYNDGWVAEDYLGNAITAQASLALTEELLNKAGHVLTTDDLPEGLVNKFYDDSLVANFINIAPGSSQYLGFNPSTGELSIKALALTTVSVDATYTSLALWAAAEYVGSPLPYQEGDIIILTAVTGGTETYINNGGNLGTVADWTVIESPNLTDSYIRSLFSGGNGLAYNNLTGVFDVNVDGTSIQITGDTLEIVPGSITTAYLAINGSPDTGNSGDILTSDGTGGFDWVAGSEYKKRSWTWGAASRASNNTDRYLDRHDGVATNQSPYVAWFNCKVTHISLSSNVASTWTAEVHVNGVVAASLASGGNQYATGVVNVNINAGDRVSFYVNGTGVNRPAIDALFLEI